MTVQTCIRDTVGLRCDAESEPRANQCTTIPGAAVSELVSIRLAPSLPACRLVPAKCGLGPVGDMATRSLPGPDRSALSPAITIRESYTFSRSRYGEFLQAGNTQLGALSTPGS